MSLALLKKLQTRAEEIAAELDNEDLPEARVNELVAEAAEVRTQHAAASERVEARNALQGLAAVPDQRNNGGQTVVVNAPARVESRGEQFVNSAEFRELQDSSSTVMNGSVEVRQIIDLGNTGGDGPALLGQPDRRPGYVDVPQPARVSQLFRQGRTDRDSVEFMVETTVAGEGQARETAEGGLKPEATIKFRKEVAPVKTIPVWVPITKQALSDLPRIRTIVDNTLSRMVEQRLDGQAIAGDGTGDNMLGVMNTPGVQTYVAPVGEAAVISIRKAKTKVSQAEYDATGVAMSAAAWERIELSTDNDGAFRVTPSPLTALAPRIWGLAVAISNKLADNTALVGAFADAATLVLREQTSITVGFVNDQFVRNLLTILAELRGAVTVERPAAFCKVTLSAADAVPA